MHFQKLKKKLNKLFSEKNKSLDEVRSDLNLITSVPEKI